ncbi:MAG: DUF58 domain-containing protein [Alphaproteobacteria bacterium]|nr:DUF58 domain-containing protein [Alphaproteobacteria bacterium]
MGKQSYSSVEIRLKDLLALKQQAEILSVPQTKKNVYTGVGDMPSPFKSRGLDFQEVRVYQPGDDIRQIDWRVTAKYGKPFTKLYTEEKDRCLFFVCDLRSNMHFASHGDFKSVIVARITAFLAFMAAHKNDRIGAVLLTDEGLHIVPVEKSDTHLMELLHGLVEPTANTHVESSLYSAFKQLGQLLPSGSFIFVLSDFCDWDEKAKKELAHFSIKNTILLCPVYDALETQLPKGKFTFSDGEKQLTLDTAKAAFQKKFSNVWAQRMHQLQVAASGQGWGLMPVDTDSDYLALLTHYCMRGEAV